MARRIEAGFSATFNLLQPAYPRLYALLRSTPQQRRARPLWYPDTSNPSSARRDSSPFAQPLQAQFGRVSGLNGAHRRPLPACFSGDQRWAQKKSLANEDVVVRGFQNPAHVSLGKPRALVERSTERRRSDCSSATFGAASGDALNELDDCPAVCLAGLRGAGQPTTARPAPRRSRVITSSGLGQAPEPEPVRYTSEDGVGLEVGSGQFLPRINSPRALPSGQPPWGAPPPAARRAPQNKTGRSPTESR